MLAKHGLGGLILHKALLSILLKVLYTRRVTWGRTCSLASHPAQKSSAELSFGACRRRPRPWIQVPASFSQMILLASELHGLSFQFKRKKGHQRSRALSFKGICILLPLGFTQPQPVLYKPSTKTEKAGTVPDLESNQMHRASLSSPCQSHSSQLVFGGFFSNHNFLFSQGPWPPASSSLLCQRLFTCSSGSTALPGRQGSSGIEIQPKGICLCLP